MKIYYDSSSNELHIGISANVSMHLKNLMHSMRRKGMFVSNLYHPSQYRAMKAGPQAQWIKIKFSKPMKDINGFLDKIQGVFQNLVDVINKTGLRIHMNEDFLKKIHIKRIFADQAWDLSRFKTDSAFVHEKLHFLQGSITSYQAKGQRIFHIIDQYVRHKGSDVASLMNKLFRNRRKIKALEEKIAGIEEVLASREKELQRNKDAMHRATLRYQTGIENLQADFQRQLQAVIQSFPGSTSLAIQDKLKELRILVFGASTVTSDDIYKIFNQQFIKHFGVSLDRKCLNTKYLNYKALKKINITRQINRDIYDYIIVGPHPHNMKGKNGKKSFLNHVKEKNLKAAVHENYQRGQFTQSLLNEISEYIIQNWKKKNS